MKDSEVRGIILHRLYEVRHSNHGMIDIPDGLGIANIPSNVLANCAGQLSEQNLISFREYMGRGYRAGSASITAHGVDVIEENAPAGIAITFDQSVNIQGSTNVQVGQRNVQASSATNSNQTASGDGATIAPRNISLWEQLIGLWQSIIRLAGLA